MKSDVNKDWEVKGMSDAEREGIRRIVEKSQFTLNNSVLDVELSDLSFQLAGISTPISGFVVSANPEFSGTNVTPTTSSYEILNPETWYFSVSADQTEVVSLTSGQAVNIVLDAFPDIEFTGKIDWISLTPDSTQTGTVYLVRVISDNFKSQASIRVGMTGDATFITGNRSEVVVIPSRFYRQDEKGIYVLTNQGKDKKYIEIGLEAGDTVEVLNGLNPQEIIYLPS